MRNHFKRMCCLILNAVLCQTICTSKKKKKIKIKLKLKSNNFFFFFFFFFFFLGGRSFYVHYLLVRFQVLLDPLHQPPRRPSTGGARHGVRRPVGGVVHGRLLPVPDPGAGASPRRRRAGHHLGFEDGQKLDAYTSFVDASAVTPAVKRTLTISGGFANALGERRGPEGVRLRVRWERVSLRAVAPAPARIGRGMDVREQQQRPAPDPHPRQRLPGHPDRRPHHRRDDRRPDVGAGQRQRAVPARRRVRQRDHGRFADPAHGVHPVHRHLRGALPSPQPRGQRADGDHQRDPRGVVVRGGGARIRQHAGDGRGARRRR